MSNVADPAPSPAPAPALAPTPEPAPAAATAPMGHPPQKNGRQWKTTGPPPPPTNCVVLKNLDYNITQVALEEVVRRVAGGRKQFVNIALIDDKASGSFRGMAFINFHSTEDATAALQELSKMVINGRKVFAEYRRLRPGEREKKDHHDKRNKKFGHFNDNRQTFEKDIAPETDSHGKMVDKRAAFFAKRDTVKKVDEQKRIDERAERDKEREADFRKRLMDYHDAEVEEGAEIEDIIFESTLSSYERRMVHMISNGLNLGHISRFDDEGNRVLHVTKDPERRAEWENESALLKAAQRKEEQEQKRKKKENGETRVAPEWKKGEPTTGGAPTKDELQGIKWFKPRAAQTASGEGSSAAAGIRAPSYKLYVPPRQPTGPDGTIGFFSRNCGGLEEEGDDDVDSNGCDDHDDAMDMNGDVEDIVNGESQEGNIADVEADSDLPAERSNGKGSSHTVLNPSVPPFSPSYATL